MKLLNEYINHALAFEDLASQESKPDVKAQFEEQAVAYRQLDRAARYGRPPPSAPDRRHQGKEKPAC